MNKTDYKGGYWPTWQQELLLQASLSRVFRETLFAEIPLELPGEISRSRALVIVPKSYRRRLSVAIYEQLVRGFRRLRWVISLGKSFLS